MRIRLSQARAPIADHMVALANAVNGRRLACLPTEMRQHPLRFSLLQYMSAIIVRLPHQLWISGCLLRPTLPFPAAHGDPFQHRFTRFATEECLERYPPALNDIVHSSSSPAICHFHPHSAVANTALVYGPKIHALNACPKLIHRAVDVTLKLHTPLPLLSMQGATV